MFNFKKKMLNPIVIAVSEKIEEALKTAGETERAEKLLDVQEESRDLFWKLGKREEKKYLIGAGLVTASAVVVLTAITGGILGAALPTALGSAFFTPGILLVAGVIGHMAYIEEAQEALQQKIDTEVFKLLEAKPEEMLKSPRIMEALKDKFNPAAAEDKYYETLVAKATPKVKEPTRHDLDMHL